MKAIKYLFIAALASGYSASAMAQDGTKADVQAVKNIISSKPADLDKQMKPYYKENKKNPENLVAFGREFYLAKDTANAKVYAEHALKASKNTYAPAYILLGDIEAIGDNGGGAASRLSIRTPKTLRLTISMLTCIARLALAVLSPNWKTCANSVLTLQLTHWKAASTTCLTTSTQHCAPITRLTRQRWKTATSATTP